MVPHAILQKGEKNANLYLLVRYPNRFHIITVNGKLTEDAEERILAAPCSDDALDEMGIKRTTIHRADLQGVGIGGGLAGDYWVLHTRDKQLRYVLSDNCSQEELDVLFNGLKRLQPPKNSPSSKLKKEWRVGGQDEKMVKKCNGLGLLVNASAFLCGAGALIDGAKHPVWYLFSLAVAVVAVALYLCYPLYFSLFGQKTYAYLRWRAPVTHLLFAAACPLLALYPHWMNVYTFRNLPLLVASAVSTVLLGILFYVRSREMRESIATFLSLLLFALVLFFQAASFLNGYLNFDELPPRPYEVVEKTSPNSCTILLSGEELELHLRLALTEAVQPGDAVMVVHDRGVLGVEYAYVVEKAE